jgi:DNA polymerase-3 subunit gamma/tau
LKKIAESEKIKISDEALKTIAERGEGSFRNSISMLDQLASFADDKDGITLDLVETTLGLAPTQAVDSLLAMVNDRDIAGILATLDQLEEQGIQPVVLADQLTRTLRFRLAEQPQLVHLLDALLSVAGSPQPQLKLLTVLIGAIKPKTAATYVSKAPAVVIEAPVPKLPAPKKTEEKKEKVVVQPISEPEIEAEAETKPAPIATGPKKPIDAASFDWVKIIEHAKKNFVALYSVLLKCEYQLDGDTLTIYAGRKFNKTKLDDTKYLTQLHETLIETGVGSVNIITLAETKPLEDAELAKVAAIMGGGKAVPVGESGETA